MEAKTRKKLEKLLWKHTHKDFRGNLNGIKTVLHFVHNVGTCVIAISALTDEELLSKLPKKLMTLSEVDRTHPSTLIRRWTIEDVEYIEKSSRLY
jgi:hypothetical protein